MNRTILSAIIFVLALVTLAVAIWGRILGTKAEETIKERQGVEQRLNEIQSLRTQRLALSHRLKRLYGRQAQLQAAPSTPEELEKVNTDLAANEQRLTAVQEQLDRMELEFKPAASPPVGPTPAPLPAQ
jgi:seryl-tRNA synthetase